MKFLRPALIVALLSVVSAGAALADDIHVIFDPGGPGTTNFIQNPGETYNVAWESCTSNGIPQGFAGDTACIAFTNETGAPISYLNFTFTVNQALVGQTIMCDNLPGDPHLSANDCNPNSDPFVLGQVVSVNFFGGSPIADNSAFFIAENGVALADVPDFGVTAPEPTSLSLLAAGMGLIGLCMVFAKR